MPRFCAIIPCYNHHHAVANVVRSLLEYVDRIIIVDDGSNQETRLVLEALSQQHQENVLLHRHEVNQGKGAAVMQGVRLADRQGYTHAIQVDADGQHDLTRTPLLLEHARTFQNDVVTAIPEYDESVNRLRYISRYLTHFWVWVETLSFSIKDSMCGFRVYPIRQFLNIVDNYKVGKRMDFDTDIMVRLYWSGCNVHNVPTRVQYLVGGLSNFRMFRDNVLISWMHTRLVLGMLRRFPQLIKRNIQASPEVSRHWSQQKEKGSYIGIRFLFGVYRWFGRGLFTVFLHPVVFFFYIFSPDKRTASREYLERLRRFTEDNKPVRWYHSYAHFIAFGHCVLDKLSAWMDRDLPVGDFQGESHYQQLESNQQGAVFIGSHLGNLEYCRAMSRSKTRKVINAVVYTEHAENFTRVLKEVNPDVDINLVQVSSFGVDTAIKFREKVEQGEILVIVGDRTSPFAHERNIDASFLDQEAAFPQGPFVLASLMECPVYLLFCLKQGKRYNLYLEPFRDGGKLPRSERAQALSAMVQDFASRLEHYCAQAPLQWFNFFDFWDTKTRSREVSEKE